MHSLLGGDVYSHGIDDWLVSWESSPGYRHWCYQVKDMTWDSLLVIMFNPGSLSGDGDNLNNDTTLRILREVCGGAKLNSFIINLFDYASPSSKNLFDNWEKKDPKDLVFNKLNFSDFIGYIFAYGDYENECEYDQKVNIKERQLLIKSHIRGLHEIHLPKNNTGTPKHPIVWQRQKMKSDITVLLRGIA